MTPDLLPPYAELHCRSNFSFLSGASHPEELVERAQALGYAALAVTDACSLAGIVRAHVAAKDAGLPLIVGSELVLDGACGSCCSRGIGRATVTSASSSRAGGERPTRARTG